MRAVGALNDEAHLVAPGLRVNMARFSFAAVSAVAKLPEKELDAADREIPEVDLEGSFPPVPVDLEAGAQRHAEPSSGRPSALGARLALVALPPPAFSEDPRVIIHNGAPQTRGFLAMTNQEVARRSE